MTVTSSGTTFLTLARALDPPLLSVHARSLIPFCLSSFFLPLPPPPPPPPPPPRSCSLFLSLSIPRHPSSSRPRHQRDTEKDTKRDSRVPVCKTRHKLRATRAYTREIFVAGIVVVFSTIPCDSAKERRESVAGTGIYVYIRTALTRSCDNSIFYCRPREHGLISS